MPDTGTTLTFLGVIALIPLAIVAIPDLPRWIKRFAWASLIIIALIAFVVYAADWKSMAPTWTIRNEESAPTPHPSAAASPSETKFRSPPAVRATDEAGPTPLSTPTPAASPVPTEIPPPTPSPQREIMLRQKTDERTQKAEETVLNILAVTPTPARSSSYETIPREAQTTSPSQSTARAQTFDLGDIVATAEWAKSNKDRLEVCFSFVNKTKQPLWLIPATRRDRGGIQATDDVKNTYTLSGTVGFKRSSLELHSNPAAMNQFLALQPNVPSLATFRLWRKRGGTTGATEVQFFATLTVVRDLATLNSYDRTVSATLTLK